MDKKARAIADGELGYLSTTSTNNYCECRWPRWEFGFSQFMQKWHLFCIFCAKVASPLVYELIDDGSQNQLIAFDAAEFRNWISKVAGYGQIDTELLWETLPDEEVLYSN